MPTPELLILVALGLVAGALGGLLGIGGSIVMIPVLTLLLRKDQHLAQASAMIVNTLVALPATLRHHRAGAVRWDVMVKVLPFGLIFIVVGVEASNRIPSDLLKRCFGLFLVYVVFVNVQRMIIRPDEVDENGQHTGWLPTGVTGAIVGFAAGLLGIGGGIIAVPLLQRLVRLPLRQCIATSAALMGVTSLLGAFRKNVTLVGLTDAAGMPMGLEIEQSLLIAACLAPTAVIGGLLGAGLTHRLPLRWVRIVLVVLLAAAAIEMLGIL